MENTSLRPSRLNMVLSVLRGGDGQGLRAFPLPRQADTSGWSYEEPSKTGSFLLIFIPVLLLFIDGGLWVSGFSELALVLFCFILFGIVLGFTISVSIWLYISSLTRIPREIYQQVRDVCEVSLI